MIWKRNRWQGGGHGLFVKQARPPVRWTAVFLILAGLLQAASLAWPFSAPPVLSAVGFTQGQPVWWLQWLALSTLAYTATAAENQRHAAWLGWWFATAWLAGSFGWLFTSMHTYGGLAAPLAALAVLALAGALALFSAAAMWLFRPLAQKNNALTAIYFAALWMLAEMARGLLLTGFGWGGVGYAQVDGPLASALPWLGAYGTGALAAGCAALMAQGLRGRSLRSWVPATMVLLLGVVPLNLLPGPQGGTVGKLSVTLLQGNIPQDEKFDQSSGVPKALRWYGQQLNASQTSLVVTPETALALLPDELPSGYWQALQQRFASGEQAALVGMPLGSYQAGYTNSVVGLKPGQATPWHYDKHHLVPFGEFIPPLFRWFTDLMNIPLGDFNRGGLAQPTFDWQGQRLATSICYENLFSEELAALFTDAALAPTMLVNISNLGWFGEHVAMDQHLHIARVRALEFDRPFLLATNTGRTAVVDHRGQVVQALPNHVAQALSATVEGRTGITPYAWWASRWGQWPLALVASVIVAFAWVVGRGRGERGRGDRVGERKLVFLGCLGQGRRQQVRR
jgi:apolipoprotein N-acyltransferase